MLINVEENGIPRWTGLLYDLSKNLSRISEIASGRVKRSFEQLSKETNPEPPYCPILRPAPQQGIHGWFRTPGFKKKLMTREVRGLRQGAHDCRFAQWTVSNCLPNVCSHPQISAALSLGQLYLQWAKVKTETHDSSKCKEWVFAESSAQNKTSLWTTPNPGKSGRWGGEIKRNSETVSSKHDMAAVIVSSHTT